MPEEQIALADIQALLVSGFNDLRHACYLLLHIKDSDGARKWLGERLAEGQITSGALDKKNREKQVINIAFTYSGLKRMGMDEAALLTFSRPFVEGMADDLRARALGDDPKNWSWGKKSDGDPLDLVLLVLADSQELLDQKRAMLEETCGRFGINSLRLLPTTEWTGIEHFGFRDGLSDPVIRGMNSKKGKRY